MTPIVDGIEQQYGEQMVFKRINADTGNGPKVVRDYRILGHPTTLIFDSQGQEVQRFLGKQTEDTVTFVLDELLN